MPDLENNNWIILDTLGNTYEIYANVTVMNLLNLNHFLIRQVELCLKSTFVKSSFIIVTIFSDVYKNPRRKSFINPSYLKHAKIIN